MAEDKINHVVEELRKEEEQAKLELTSIETKQKQLKKELQRIQAGIAGLVGKAGKNLAKKSSASKQSPAAGSRALSAGVVVEMTQKILSSYTCLTEVELERRLEERILSEGKSTSGLSIQLKKALKDGRFVPSLSGWKLRGEVQQAPELQLDTAATD